MSAKPRPGYVYVLKNPLLEGWVKIGRTVRSPHKRAQELSTTAWSENFRVAHAKFFWDSVHAEQEIHAKLKQELSEERKKKEFFQMDTVDAMTQLDALEDPIWKHSSVIDENWDPSFQGRDMLEDRWQWAEEKLLIPSERNQGWRELEQVSAEGWAGWCRTWPNGEGLQALLDSTWRHYGQRDAYQWPALLVEMFETEIFFWSLKPERAFPHPWWGALAEAWNQEAEEMGEDWNKNRRQAWLHLRSQTIQTSEEIVATHSIKRSF